MTTKIILKKPIITEKSSRLLENNQYTFFVNVDVNKIEVKQYIQSEYGVVPEKVNFIKVRPKKRRRGRIVGQTAQRKKAIVFLKEGQSIDSIKEMF